MRLYHSTKPFRDNTCKYTTKNEHNRIAQKQTNTGIRDFNDFFSLPFVSHESPEELELSGAFGWVEGSGDFLWVDGDTVEGEHAVGKTQHPHAPTQSMIEIRIMFRNVRVVITECTLFCQKLFMPHLHSFVFGIRSGLNEVGYLPNYRTSNTCACKGYYFGNHGLIIDKCW